MWQSVQIELAAHFVLLPKSAIRACWDFGILLFTWKSGLNGIITVWYLKLCELTRKA